MKQDNLTICSTTPTQAAALGDDMCIIVDYVVYAIGSCDVWFDFFSMDEVNDWLQSADQ
jgi:hypothetical protein